MRALALACATLTLGCGFDPHQTYSLSQDAGGDRVVAAEALPEDLQATAGPPDGADAGNDVLGVADTKMAESPDAVDTGRLDGLSAERQDALAPCWVSMAGCDGGSDLIPAQSEAGQETRGDVKGLDDMQSVPDAYPDSTAIPDLSPDRLASPDLIPVPDFGTDPVALADATPQCTCLDPSRPFCVRCQDGTAYQASAVNALLSTPAYCPATGESWFCYQWCLKNWECPSGTPYCNATSGKCSTTQ